MQSNGDTAMTEQSISRKSREAQVQEHDVPRLVVEASVSFSGPSVQQNRCPRPATLVVMTVRGCGMPNRYVRQTGQRLGFNILNKPNLLYRDFGLAGANGNPDRKPNDSMIPSWKGITSKRLRLG